MYRIILTILALFVASVAHAATLEIPGPNSVQSGIQLISGWKCEVNGSLTIRFDGGEAIPLVYGSERGDTRKPKGPCDDANNGFVAIMNWGNLGDGEHTAVVHDNGVEFDRATFWVVTPGTDFLQGVTGSAIGSLSNGQMVALTWSEASQGFIATRFTPVPSTLDENSDCHRPQPTQIITATVFDGPDSSQAGRALWTVENACDREEIAITLTPLTAEGFRLLPSQVGFVQNGYQFDSDHFYMIEYDSTQVLISEHYQPGSTVLIILEALDGSHLDFSQPFVITYYGKEILTFP